MAEIKIHGISYLFLLHLDTKSRVVIMSVFTVVVKGERPGNSITSDFITLNLYLSEILGYFTMSIVLFSLVKKQHVLFVSQD